MRIDTISQWLHRLVAEGNQIRIRIAFDEENSAQTWIDAARERISDAPARLRPLLQPFPPESVTVSPAEALAALEWASTLPGWDDGPEYAQTPLIFHELDEEEFDWVYEQNPGWDSTGTIAESWSTEVGRYVARIDHFRDEDGGGYAYSVSIDGNYVKGGENESAESFEAAEDAIRRLLADRI